MTDPLSPRNPSVNALRREHDELRSRLFKNQEERVELTDAAKSVRAAIAALDPFDDGEELEEAQRPLEGLEPAPEDAHKSPISTSLDALFTGVSIALKLPIDPSVLRCVIAEFKRGDEVLETHFPDLPEDAPMIAAVQMLKNLGYRLEGKVWFPPEKAEPPPYANTREGAAFATLERLGYSYIEGDAHWHQARRIVTADPLPATVDALKAALQHDPELAWAWHCNIAMPIKDAIPTATHRLANMAAARVMRHVFDVDTESSPRMPAPDPAPEVLKVGISEPEAKVAEEVHPIGRRYCLMPHVEGIATVIRFEDFGDLVVARPAGADANVVTEARLSQVQFLSPALARAHEEAMEERVLALASQPQPASAAMPEGHIEPSVGRKVWLRIAPMLRRNVARHVIVHDGQPVDATIAWVHPDKHGSEYSYVTVFVIDHDGESHRLVVPLRQHYQPEPLAREWVEWMPFQVGQAKKSGAA